MSITRNMRDGQIEILDNGANSLTLDTDEGDLSIEWGNEDRLIKQRGSVTSGHFREGDEEPVTGTVNVKVSQIRADDTSMGGTDDEPTPYDALHQVGPAAAWESTGESGEPYLCKLRFKLANPDSTGRREVIVLDKVRVGRVTFSEGDEYDTLAFPFTARIAEPTFTFEAQS